MINVVLPMAGEGSRFAKAGFKEPKPFISVNGEPMIVKVLKNLRVPHARFFLIARESHLENSSTIVKKIEQEFPVRFIPISQKTEGAACTVLFARKFIDNDTPLLLANSDQIIDIKIEDFLEDCSLRSLDGSIMTFNDSERNPKWSFAKVDSDGRVIVVKEKDPISEHATVGIYLFSKGKYFVDSAVDMIIHNERVNNEFYTCPAYNHLINDGKKIGIFEIPAQCMHGLGTPEDLEKYLRTQPF